MPGAALLVFMTLAGGTAAAEPPEILDDFESGGLATRWVAQGAIRAERASAEHRRGAFLRILADPGATLATRAPPWKTPLRPSDAIAIDLRPRDATRVVIDIRLTATVDRRAAPRWRRVEVSGPDWRTITLPIATFRDDEFTLVSETDLNGLEIRFRTGGDIEVDDIRLIRPPEPDALLTGYANSAFPDGQCRRRVIGPGDGALGRVIILTDATELNLDSLAADLTAARNRFEADFPGADVAPGDMPLLIFASRARFEAFWARLAPDVRVHPDADGLTALRIATAVCDAEDPSRIRDVFTHEMAHMLVARRFGLTPRPDWLHEGLATRYQRGSEPASREDAGDVSLRLDGSDIPIRDYARVGDFVDYLARDAAARRSLAEAITMMRATGANDLTRVARQAFGQSVADLLRRRREWRPAAPTRP